MSSTKRKQPGTSSIGLNLEVTMIKNINRVKYDVEIDSSNFADTSCTPLMDQQAFLLDRTSVVREDFLQCDNSYCQVKWSPLNCTVDGRLVTCEVPEKQLWEVSALVAYHDNAFQIFFLRCICIFSLSFF